MLIVPQRFSSSRRFPHLSWAWPNGGRQQLLFAAAHADERRAAEAFAGWLATTNLDDAQFPEQRLLVRAANRFPETRLQVPERARLNGIVRKLWTQARLALSNAAPALKALRDGGIDLLVLKGMVQTALDVQNLKGRIAYDIDVLVRGPDLPAAFSILDGAGWRSARGESVQFLKARGARFRSLNFLKPPFGDIDLHTRAYMTTTPRSEAEVGLWTRSTRTALLDIDVLVPSPTDRLVNAIAHGGLDAHRHSDWLVDCAQLIDEGGIDWPLVMRLADDLGISAQVTLALFYLREMLGVAVPEAILGQLWERARSSPVDYYKALLLGYPREKHSLFSRVGRQVYKLHQNAQVKAANAADASHLATRDIRLRRADAPHGLADAAAALRHRLAVPPGARRCRIFIGMDAVSRPRRYVFEINAGDGHVARVRFNDRRGRGPLVLAVEIVLPEYVAGNDLWIDARQSGILPTLHSAEEEAEFAPQPFRAVARWAAAA